MIRLRNASRAAEFTHRQANGPDVITITRRERALIVNGPAAVAVVQQLIRRVQKMRTVSLQWEHNVEAP
jgi:hypothetical protein